MAHLALATTNGSLSPAFKAEIESLRPLALEALRLQLAIQAHQAAYGSLPTAEANTMAHLRREWRRRHKTAALDDLPEVEVLRETLFDNEVPPDYLPTRPEPIWIAAL